MNIALRCIGVVFLVLTLSRALVAAQESEVVCRQQFKTPNNCYRLGYQASHALTTSPTAGNCTPHRWITLAAALSPES
jgi:hypothetical protein